MSISETLNISTRPIGDASLRMPETAKTSFVSADNTTLDGFTGDWILSFRLNRQMLFGSLNSPDDDSRIPDAWPVTIGFSADGSIKIRRQAQGTVNYFRVYYLVTGVTIDFVDIDCTGVRTLYGGEEHFAIIKNGSSLSGHCLGVVEGEATSGAGPTLLSDAINLGSDRNMDADMMAGESARLRLGAKIDGSPRGCSLNSFVMAAINPVNTIVDTELNTDAQIMSFMHDPARILVKHAAKFDKILSFDLCNAAGERKLLHQRTQLLATDKLVCPNTAKILNQVIEAEATKTAEGMPPYTPSTFGVSVFHSTNANPQSQIVDGVVVGTTMCLNGAFNADLYLHALNPATGLAAKPMIPIPVAWGFFNSSSANAEELVWNDKPGTTGNTNIGDNHIDASVCVTATGIYISRSYHLDFWTDWPQVGDRTWSGGLVYKITDGGENPLPLLLPTTSDNSSTGIYRACTSYSALIESSGDVYFLTRASDTVSGKLRICRIAANDALTSRNVTSEGQSSATGAGIPFGFYPMADGKIMATANVRIGGSTDYAGCFGVLFDPSQFDSTTDGWWATNGDNVAASLGGIRWDDSRFYLQPGPAKDALIARESGGSYAPTEGETARDIRISGSKVGVIGAITDDPEGTRLTSAYGLDVLDYAATPTPRLTHVRNHDLLPTIQSLAPGWRDAALTIREWQAIGVNVYRPGSNAKDILCFLPLANGTDLSNQIYGFGANHVGTTLAVFRIGDWTANPPAIVEGDATVFPAADYGSSILLSDTVAGNGFMPVRLGPTDPKSFTATSEAYPAVFDLASVLAGVPLPEAAYTRPKSLLHPRFPPLLG